MKQILLNYSLTNPMYALIDDEDYDKVIKYNWYALKCNKRIYSKANVNNKPVFMHHFILNANEHTDHIDGNGLNNQKTNLRFCNQTLNNANNHKRLNASSKYKGVSYCKFTSLWRSIIKNNGITHDLGRYNTQVDAAKAYDKAAKKYFKEFARLNFNEFNS